jgi:hypothetical protein
MLREPREPDRVQQQAPGDRVSRQDDH